MSSHWFRPSRYSRLPTDPEEAAKDDKPSKTEPKANLTGSLSIKALLAIVAAVAILSVPIGHVMKSFRFDQSFANPPTKGAPEPVWDSLTPIISRAFGSLVSAYRHIEGLGYVKGTPLIGPNLSVISSFHQLHCLYTLRRAYFSDTAGGEDFDFGLDRSNHTAHCFEYLRQSIMCSADPTLEPTENAETGFLGWGFQRQCRDYDALKEWAEDWKAFEMRGFLAHPSIGDE